MQDLNKVSSTQLYLFWRSLSVGLLTLVAVMALSLLLPFYLSPIIAVAATAGLYTLIYNNRIKPTESCMLVPYSIFYTLITYAFVSIIVNVLWLWGIINPKLIPPELIFLNKPFIPSLYLCPCAFVTLVVMYLRRNSLGICRECRIAHGNRSERGRMGAIFFHESHFQLRNMAFIFGLLSVLIWAYYLFRYVRIDVSARDWYVFTWSVIIVIVLDEIYFIARYVNLYLDLRENDEIISDEEIQDLSAKTYLRFYVCCGENLIVDTHAIDPATPYREMIDTPYVTHRSVNGISVSEVRDIIERMTGFKGGELRFLYGRRSTDLKNHCILRYCYVLPGDVSQYNDLKVQGGEWMSFEKLKHIYSTTPGLLTPLAAADISRLASIVLTYKTFNEKGYRRNKLKSYKPSFKLEDVMNPELDFQDDKWIRISTFNSDVPFYSLRRWWRNRRSRQREVRRSQSW